MTIEYTITPNAFSGSVKHVIDGGQLTVTREKTGAVVELPLSTIKEVNLRQEMAGVWNVNVKPMKGAPLRIPSRHFKSLGRFEDRNTEYKAFVRALLEGTASANPAAKLTAGSSGLYVLGWVFVVFAVLLGIGVVFVMMTGTMPRLSSLWWLPMSIFIGYGFIKQGKARTVDPKNPPLLPP